MAETKNTTAVKTATTKTTTSTKEKQLEEQVAQLMEQVKILTSALNATAQSSNVVTTPTAVNSNSDVSLVYMSDSLGVIRYGNGIELNCTRFGEEFVITRSAFDEIVGRYRKWFDAGMLAVSYKNVDVAAAKGVRTDKEYALSAEKLHDLGKISVQDIEKLWEENPTEAHRLSIVTYFKRKFIEGKESGFRDRSRVDCLNRLTNGGFAQESRELGGDYKIRPTNMND